MRIALLFNKETEHTIGVYIHKLLQETEHDVHHFWTRDAKYLEPAFDLYIRVDHGDYKYDLPKTLHPSAFWVSDIHLKKPYNKIRAQVGHYDYVFCCQKQGAERLRKELNINTCWVPHAFSPELIKPVSEDKIYDIGFVGTEGKKSLRKVLMKELKALFPESYIDQAPYKHMAEIYSASKIGFNYSIQNDINMRMFEIIGSGAMLLTNEIKNNGFEDIFEDRVNCVVYRSKDECLELAQYYLEHQEEREKIARAGFDLSKHHTYRKRLDKIFSHLPTNA